ncbi:MAG: DUF2240 family protein [Methanoregula sp.]|nr:DUF2240 family protein [Methanoregula sp.]
MNLKITVAAPFKHTRKTGMRKNELVYYYSLDRKWMSTEQAGILLHRAEEEGLLNQKDGVFSPLFDTASVIIPIGFKPTSSIFERNDPLGDLIDRIAKAQGIRETDVVSGMNQIIKEQFDGNLLPAAALVLLAKKYNVPFSDKREALIGTMKKK